MLTDLKDDLIISYVFLYQTQFGLTFVFKIIHAHRNNKQRLEKLMLKFVIISNRLWRYVLHKNGMQKRLLSTTYLSPFTDSSNKKWTDAVIDGLPLKDGGQLQWTRYVRRRIIRWTRGKCYLITLHRNVFQFTIINDFKFIVPL